MLTFPTRGYRPKAGYSLHYRSKCRRYRVTCGDLVGGVNLAHHGLKPSWLAIVETATGQRIISKHWSKARAVDACTRHERKRQNV